MYGPLQIELDLLAASDSGSTERSKKSQRNCRMVAKKQKNNAMLSAGKNLKLAVREVSGAKASIIGRNMQEECTSVERLKRIDTAWPYALSLF